MRILNVERHTSSQLRHIRESMHSTRPRLAPVQTLRVRTRPRLILGSLVMLVSLFAAPGVHSQNLNSSITPADTWPQFRGNPALTGATEATLPAELTLQWTYEADEAIDSSAAIADGTVYVGTWAGSVIALDLATGEERWVYKTGDMGIGESSPAVAEGLVFVGDLGGVFHAIDAETGEARWTFETMGEIKSSPVIVDDRVLIGSYDGYLYALSLHDGALIWQYETLNYVHATPAVWDGIAYFGGCDEVFHGVRISDGEEVVSLSAGAYTAASPVITDNKVFFGTFDNEVIGLDLETHELLWRYEHPDRHFPFYSSALATRNTIVIGGRDKMVHAIDDATGEARWTFTTRARVDSSPAASGDHVYAGSSDGRLYVLDLGTGDKLWEFDTAAPLVASPAIAEGRLVIGSEDGVLYCFG